MDNRIVGALLAVAGTVTVISIVLSQSPYAYNADINGDGEFNSGDQGILAEQIIAGNTVPANPCVEYVVISDAQPYIEPTNGALTINSLQTVVTPAYGGSYRISADHPAYQAFLDGTPWPQLRACP